MFTIKGTGVHGLLQSDVFDERNLEAVECYKTYTP